jgi:hypothetical protein
VSMHINPLHRDPFGASIVDYEEPVATPESPNIMMDSELYVAVSSVAGEGSTTVHRESGAVTDAVPLGESANIMMDTELYVAARNDAGEGSTAVHRDAVPLEGRSGTTSDYIEVAGGTAVDAPASYAVFLSTTPTEETPSCSGHCLPRVHEPGRLGLIPHCECAPSNG